MVVWRATSLLYSHFNVLNIQPVGRCLGLAESRLRVRMSLGGRERLRKWQLRVRGKRTWAPGFPQVLCAVQNPCCYIYTEVFLLTRSNCHLKGCELSRSKLSLPSQPALVGGFACQLEGVNVSGFGLCRCTNRTIWCWPALGSLLWSVTAVLGCPCSPPSFTEAWCRINKSGLTVVVNGEQAEEVEARSSPVSPPHRRRSCIMSKSGTQGFGIWWSPPDSSVSVAPAVSQ